MEKKVKNVFLSSIILIAFGLAFIPSYQALGADFNYKLLETVPGFLSAGEAYSFNQYVSAIYKFLIWTAGITSLFMISLGAYMYITSAGNQAAMSKAKTFIFDAAIGLILVLVAWLILYTINPNLVSLQGVSEESQEGTATEAGTLPAGTLSDTEAREKLAAAGISVNASEPTTSLQGIPSSTVDKLIKLKQESGVNITVTGGTEKAGHSITTNHGPGNAVVDIKVSSGDQAAMNNYLKNNRGTLGITTVFSSSGYTDNTTVNEPAGVYHLEFTRGSGASGSF